MRHNQYATLPVLPSGALALATDTKKLYFSDGVRWIDPSEPPVGAPYTRMPGDPLPSSVWPGTTWTKVSGSGNLAGTFPRFDGQYSGHEACAYNTVYASQNKSHSHGGATGGMSANDPHDHSASSGTDSPDHTHTLASLSYTGGTASVYGGTANQGTIYTSGASARHTHAITVNARSMAHTHSVSADGGTEARPVAVGIEHYRRAA